MKKTKKKVVKKKLIGFDKEMLSALDDRVNSGYAENETEVLRRLLTGEQSFRADIESWIAEQRIRTGLSRDEVIQSAILEALQLKDERFRLILKVQGKK